MSYANGNCKDRQKPHALQDSHLDFRLSRQAMLCTKNTMAFYSKTLGKFVEWLSDKGVTSPSQITTRQVREYLIYHKQRGCSDSYIHTFARSIRTYLHFLLEEKYITEAITFKMPRIEQKLLPVLSLDEIRKVLDACENMRDSAIILFLVDTGLRRGEASALNWGDVDLATGLCLVRKGKGKKARSVVIGIRTRRTLLKYKQTISSQDDDPLFQTKTGSRLSGGGFRSMCSRLSEKTDIKISPHALRRTFVVMSFKSGMSLAHIQALMGHSTPTMTLKYAQLVEDDLVVAHREHGPVDSFIRQ